MKYLCDPHIVPTNTCPPDVAELEKRSTVFTAFAKDIQLDVADGMFAPVTSWPYLEDQFNALEKLIDDGFRLPFANTLYYEAHLMVKDPAQIGELLARAGCKRLLPHLETISDEAAARAMFDAWKAAGAEEVGVSLLIDTPMSAIEPYADMISVVQLMSIAVIGAQGQPFDDRALSRVEELHAMYPDLLVAVDGGVSEANVEELVRAGANRLCVGSAISKSADPEAAYAAIHERAMLGCKPITIEMGV